MRRNKGRGVGVAIACACAFAAINTSAAWAGKVLNLETGGKPAANGSTAYTALALGPCTIYAKDTVVADGASKDELTATGNAFNECVEPTTLAGTVTATQLLSSGKATLTATIEVTEPATPCVYKFSKFKGKFTVGGELSFKGTVKGTLNKSASAKTCAKSVTEEYFADVTPQLEGEPFEAIVTK